MAAHTGLALVIRRSCSFICAGHVNRGWNRPLKNTLFMAAFESLPAEGKKHDSALINLARRKTNVICAMARNHKRYTPSARVAA